jgi:hypothetical protein
MPRPTAFDLLAADDFRPNEIGWLTSQGVIKVEHQKGLPKSVVQVRAMDHVQAGQHGRFIEISGKPDIH